MIPGAYVLFPEVNNFANEQAPLQKPSFGWSNVVRNEEKIIVI